MQLLENSGTLVKLEYGRKGKAKYFQFTIQRNN